MVGAKFIQGIGLVSLIFLVSGCAGAQRFLPPGFVKQEDLAGDQPIDPSIQAAIDEQSRAPDQDFPKMADQPSEIPDGIQAGMRENLYSGLQAKREGLREDIDLDRLTAAQERAVALQAEAEALALAVAQDREAALAERRKNLSADDQPTEAEISAAEK